MERKPEGAGPETTGNQGERRPEHDQLSEGGAQIYVASLTDYVNGQLHGAWIDADQEPDALQSDIEAMLAQSPSGHAEEFAIHDTTGFGHYRVDEYDSLERVSRVARGLHQHGPAFGAWAEHCDQDDALDRFDDAYLGDFPSITAYAEDLIDSIGLEQELDRHIPDTLRAYVTVDVEGLARDLELGGDITAVEHTGGVWIFDGSL